MDSLAGLKGVEVGSVFLRNNAVIRCWCILQAVY